MEKAGPGKLIVLPLSNKLLVSYVRRARGTVEFGSTNVWYDGAAKRLTTWIEALKD